MEGAAGGELSAPVTGGVCGDCAWSLGADIGPRPFQEFLDGLGAPVLLVDHDARVMAANWQARDVLGKELSGIVGFKCGDVIECRNSGLVGGCGRTPDCRACGIRNAVAKTHLTAKPLLKAAAYPDVQAGAGFKTMSMRITTEKVGSFVLMRIDQMFAVPEA